MRIKEANLGCTVFSKSARRGSGDRETDRSFESSRALPSQGNMGELRKHRDLLAQYPPVDPLLQGMLYLEDNDANGILELSKQVEDDEVMKYTLWGMIAEAQGDINNAGQYYFHVSNQERPTWFASNS